MKIRRTILFTNQDNTDRYCVIDEELNNKNFKPKFEINEYVFGQKMNSFTRYGIMDENKEIIEFDKYKNRKLEKGYIEIPNSQYGYDDLFGVFKKEEGYITFRKYFDFTEEFVPVRIQGCPPKEFSREIFNYIVANQSSLKRKLIDKLFIDYCDIKELAKIDWDDDDFEEHYPNLTNKNDILKMTDFRGINIPDEYFFNHEASDNSKFEIVGECFWEMEHGFEIYFDKDFEIQN